MNDKSRKPLRQRLADLCDQWEREAAETGRTAHQLIEFDTLEQMERTAIARALERCSGNQSAAARLLGAKSTLNDRIRRFGQGRKAGPRRTVQLTAVRAQLRCVAELRRLVEQP